MFIEADNPDIGLMCMIAIGMAEVSTCDMTVKEGQHVKKGDQMGMFHFGVSNFCAEGCDTNDTNALIGKHALLDLQARIEATLER